MCHTTLLKRVKSAKIVNASMGVSTTAAEAEDIEEPRNVGITLPVHNKRGTRWV
jgi:hypothetical protein